MSASTESTVEAPFGASAPEDARSWIVDFLRESGALVEESPEGRLAAVLPDPLAARLGRGFLDLSDATEDVLLAPGSPFLDGALEEAQRRGLCARRYLWSPLKKSLSLEDVQRRASFLGVRPKGLLASPVHTPMLLVHFHVSFLSDDREEELLPVLFHPLLGRSIPATAYQSAVPSDRNELGYPERPLPSARGTLEAAARAAQELIVPRREKLEERQGRRFGREAARVREYFAAVRTDLERRLTREGLAADRRASIGDKLKALALEERNKLTDLAEKHRLSVHLTAVAAAVLMTPQIVGTLSLEARGAANPVPVEVFWDPFLRDVLLPSCAVCGLEAVRLAVCPRCRRVLCGAHAGDCVC